MAVISKITLPSGTTYDIKDTKVTNTLATTTKAYITGTTSAATNTGTQVFDTGVYLDTTAGQLTATTFKGNLSGNASTSTSATTLTGLTATINELNKLDGVTATTTELNYIDGVTSNIQTQLNNKVPTSRTVNGKALSSNISLSIDDLTAGYLNTHPENSPTIIPFINNDIAFLTKKGGSCSMYSTSNTDYTVATLSNKGTVSCNSIDNMFDGTPSYNQISTTGEYTMIIDLALHKTFSYSNKFYIDFGSASWRAKNIALYVMNSSTETTYKKKNEKTNSSLGNWYSDCSHTSTNSSGTTVQGFNKIRIVLSGWNNTSSSSGKRIAQIGLINYGSAGVSETFVSKGGGTVYGNIYPYSNNTTTLGTSSNKWSNIYATTFTGNLSGKATSADSLTGVTATTTELNYVDGVTSNIQTQLNGKAASSHTHNYAGSSSAGGAATSANKINTNAGSATQPVYFSGGVPVATTYTLGKSVPNNAVFTDTNTKVTQTLSSTNANYPLLLAPTGQTATTTTTSVFGTKFQANPNTGTLTATTFSGALSGNATTATTASKLGSSTVGGSLAPIYLNSGTATACPTPKSGSWTGVPNIGADGVMEVGKYIDFHEVGSTADYDARLTASTSGFSLSGTTSGTFSGSLSGNASTATKLKTARTFRTNLGSTDTASFDGSANVIPGVTGTLAISNGGTGATTWYGALSKLGLVGASAQGTNTSTIVSLSNGTITKIPLANFDGLGGGGAIGDGNGVNATTGNTCEISSGSVKINDSGVYLVAASVYIESNSFTGNLYKGVYVKDSSNRELLSNIYTGYISGTTTSGAVSAAPKLLYLESGTVLSLYGRIGGVAGKAYSGNNGTYLTVLKVGGLS